MGSRIDFRVATPQDDADLRHLLRDNPMPGAVSVTLEREPDVFLAGRAEGDPHHTIVARDGPGGPTVGMASRSVYAGFVNGAPSAIGYLSQLRVDRRYRGRPGVLAQGYALMRSLREPGALPFDVTTIVADNHVARRVLGAGLTRLPAYRALEPFTTLLVPIWRRRGLKQVDGMRIERGSPERLPAIAACLARNAPRFQFARRWTVDDLQSPDRCRGLAPHDFLVATTADGGVAGCLACWDQGSFKQIVVHGYAAGLRRWRPAVDLAARLIGVPRVPPEGRPIPHASVSHVAVDGDRPDVFAALAAQAYEDARAAGQAFLVFGFADRHPFLPLLRRYRSWSYGSVIYAVCWDGGDAAASLDGRVPHLEVSLL
jgi:hypothetical protein